MRIEAIIQTNNKMYEVILIFFLIKIEIINKTKDIRGTSLKYVIEKNIMLGCDNIRII